MGLAREVERLTDRLGAATPGWYAARPRGPRSRAEVLRALVAILADLGREAGTGVPAGIVPPVLADHGLAAQLTLLASELDGAPVDRTGEALAALRAARDEL